MSSKYQDPSIYGVIIKLTQKINDILNTEIKTERGLIKFVAKDEMRKLCCHVPGCLSENKPSRVVVCGDFGVPCGGTHVAQLKDIGYENIRKIKAKGNNIRVSYEIS